jgi:hypothetical protein
MGLPSPEQASTWGGKMVVDREGAPIGTVTQIYSDNATGLPEWATTRLGEATVFLPLLDAVEADGQVHVRVKRDDVAKAPMVGPGRRITEQEEARLYSYYGIDYTPERSPSGLPRGVGPIPSRAQVLLRRLRGLEAAPLALAGVFTAAAVLVAALGLRRRSNPRPAEAVLTGGAAAVASTEAARRAAVRAARDARRQAADARRQWREAGRQARDAARRASDAAGATAHTLAEPAAPRRRRGRNSGRGRGTRRG